MKYITIRKKSLIVGIIGFLVICALTAGAGLTGAGGVFLGRTQKLSPIFSAGPERKAVALTFDAVSSGSDTDGVLKILSEQSVSATFFVSAVWAAANAGDMAKVAAAGHETGARATLDENILQLSDAGIKTDIEASQKAVAEAAKKEVTLFRAADGVYDDRLLTIIGGTGLKAICWDVDARERAGETAMQTVTRAVMTVKNGSIVVASMNGSHTAKLLPTLILSIRNRGFEILTVGELLRNL